MNNNRSIVYIGILVLQSTKFQLIYAVQTAIKPLFTAIKISFFQSINNNKARLKNE